MQQATGHPDSPEEMYKYLVAVSRQPDHAKIRAYCDGSVEHFNWLEDLGFQFERSYFPGKAVIQPNTEGLMFTGNEKVWPFLRAGGAGAARPQGAGARRHRRRQHGDRPAAQASREPGRANPLRDRRHRAHRGRFGRGDRRAVEAVFRNRCDQGKVGHHRRRGIRDEPGDGSQVHPETGREAVRARQYLRRRPGHPAGRLGRRRHPAHGPDLHHGAALPAVDPAHRDHREQARHSASSPKTPTIPGPPGSSWISPTARRF